MNYPLYSTIELFSKSPVMQVNSSGPDTPYSGPAVLWIQKPAGTPAAHGITCGIDGTWSYSIYLNLPDVWSYVVRRIGDSPGAMLDESFRVNESFAPEAVPPDIVYPAASHEPMYWGVGTSIPTTEANVLALSNSEVRANFLRRISIAATAQRLVIAYPAQWGAANIRFVTGGFGIAMVWTTITVAGVLCNVGYSFAANMTFALQDLEIY